MLFCVWGYTQELPNILPPSPEPSALIKYAQTEMTPYTGLPNISIPFHTITHKGVNIPISLTYSGGGVKVADIASWVGLGWNLQAGGLVTRTINWLPDDKSTWGYMNTIYDLQHFADNPDDPNTFPYCCEVDKHSDLLSDENVHQRDYEPDEFTYTIPGYSGTFYYDQNISDFVELPRTNVKINAVKNSSGKILGFTIITPDGVQYQFGGSEEYLEKIKAVKSYSLTMDGLFYSSNVKGYESTTDLYYQSWMLKKIIFPNTNDHIAFNYIIEDNVKAIVLSDEEMILPVGDYTLKHNRNYIEKKFTQPKLSEILFPSGKISFKRSTIERLDLKNSYALEKITLYDYNNSFVKSFILNTEQSEAKLMRNYTPPFFDVHNIEGKNRLRLKSISQIDQNENLNSTYSFEYNEQKLPSRYSNAVDYFGYFNGQLNDNKIPKARGYVAGLPNVYKGSANRAIHPNYTQAEMLTKITYPTGGIEEFVWENHKISFFLYGNPSQYRDYLLKETIALQNTSLFLDSNFSSTVYSHTFTISPNSDGWVNFDIEMLGCLGPELNNSNCPYIISLTGVDTAFSHNVALSDYKIQLIPGKTYKIMAKSRNGETFCDPINDPNCSNSSPFLNAIINYDIDPTPNEYLFGGLRVAKIKTYDDSSSSFPTTSIQYDYKFHDSEPTPNITSGMVYQLPINHITNFNAQNDYANGIAHTTKITASASLIPVKRGALVGYKNVTEFHNNKGLSNGFKEYKFNDLDVWGDYQFSNNYFNSPFPRIYKRNLRPDWRNGNLNEIKYYNNTNSLVKHDFFEYETFDTFHKKGSEFAVQVFRMPPIQNPNVPETAFTNAYATYYGYTTEYYRLKQHKVIDYFTNGNVENTSSYHYNNPLLFSEITTINSEGEVLKTKNYYPNDVKSISSLNHDNLTTLEKEAIDQLKLQNRIAKPIQVETFKDNVLLSTQRTNYKNTKGLYLPEVIQTSKGSQNLEDRIVYHNYDDKGNPVEVSKKDGTKIYYVWGYNQTQPIAKIKSYTDIELANIASLINTAISASNSDTDAASENNLRTALNNIRNNANMVNSQVTTFTYDPLIGVTSITDPRGQTIYYEYDDFNRLEFVKDADGNLLKEYKYNYKN